MAITKAQKHELVQDYADLLSRSNGVILANNLGLPVAEMSELREQIRALESAGFSQFSSHIRFGHESSIEDWVDVIEGL